MPGGRKEVKSKCLGLYLLMIMGAGAGPGAAAAARVVAQPGVRLRRGKGRNEPGPGGSPGNSARFRPGRDFGAPDLHLRLLLLWAGFSFRKELLAPPA